MNQKKKLWKRYSVLQSLKFSSKSGNKLNLFNYWVSNSDEHENVKWEIFKYLRKQGYDMLTEAEFVSGGRADLVAISPTGEGYIIEVLHTESDERFNLKVKKYPQDMEIVKVNTKGFNINEFDL